MLNLLSNQKGAVPLFPAKPVFGSGIPLSRNRDISSILDNKFVSRVSSGYAAILLALKEENISNGDEVLIPAYHCTDLVEPILDMNATPVFYAINEDISINIDDVSAKITANTKAVLVPHFFGVVQNVMQLRQANDLLSKVCIIEDYAHAFFWQQSDDQRVGDYIVGSLTKFFPTFDGGLLVANKEIKNTPLPLSVVKELKSFYNVFHLASQYGRVKWIAWLFGLMALLRKRSIDSNNVARDNHIDAQPSNIDIGDVEIYAASKTCNYIVNHSDFKRIVDKRRQNYFYILDGLKDEENLDLSFNCRDSEFIPYMVVGKLRKPELHHPLIIQKNLPVWRWEHIYPSHCDIAKEYSRSIIQIPCHQQLSSTELAGIVDGIKECLREG